MTQFTVFDSGGYVVRTGLPILEASNFATLIGGTVAKSAERTPITRLRDALAVLAQQSAQMPPALAWFVEEAQSASEELDSTSNQERVG